MGGAAGKSVDNGDLRLPLAGDGQTAPAEPDFPQPAAATGARAWAAWLALLVVDFAASAAFWTLFFYLPDRLVGAFFACLVTAMVLWRVWRLRTRRGPAPAAGDGVQVPYSCGFVAANGKELFLVATVHISPRAPRDVKAVISGVRPDAAMIELDEERLDRLRDSEMQKKRTPKTEDLQPITITCGADTEPVTVYAQRALWNAERAGERVSGRVVFQPEDPFGASPPGESADGQLALVLRGPRAPDQRLATFAPFAVKAHVAAKGGVQALLAVNWQDELPVQRLGGGTLLGDLQVAYRTRNCGFPRIPVFLLSKTEGERLQQKSVEGVEVRAELEIMQDSYPRRTLRKRLCQNCALLFSGIGILYGIIGLFDVEVGAEFTEAEVAASAQGIPCACIDVDMNRFWSRLGWAVLPMPRNLVDAVLSWLAFPRIFAQFLFPPRGNVDNVGCMILHLASLTARTWIAFVIAGFGASTVATYTLQGFGNVAERGAEETGVVKTQDRAAAQTYIFLLIEAFLLPQICQAVAASRDENMYRSIVSKGRELGARRLVAVVGAGHANGILHYARTQGL